MAFEQRLAELGYQEGKNFAFEFVQISSVEGYESGFRELIARNIDIIFAGGAELGLKWALKATNTLPIVMIAIDYDPFARGYVTSLAQPSGNITGVIVRPLDLARKQIDLLRQVFPDRNRLAVLYDTQTADQFTAAEQGAKSLALKVQAFKVEPAYDFASAFEAAAKGGVQLMMVQSSPAFAKHREQLAQLAIQHRLPTMFTFRHYADACGLMSYGVEFPLLWRRTADYVARMLKGAKAAELPIEQPTKFELVVNFKRPRRLALLYLMAFFWRLTK